jgi:iron complex outermembrane receptor protein
MQMNKLFKGSLFGASAIGAMSMALGAAHAQDVTPNPAAAPAPITPTREAAVQSQASNAGEVVVTARRRNETLVDVPISMTVVTAAKIEQLDLRGTTDIANYTPSLTFNSYTPGDARNDAGPDRQIIFRGLNSGTTERPEGAAGLFLDGAPITGNELPASMDIGQVEVLRGPQSVYFGRSTESGAVSYRTRSIGDTWSGEFEGIAADQNERDLQATVAGPVIPGLLKMRVTGVDNSYGGYVSNSFPGASEDLGATQRKSISATAILTPTSNIEVKGYVNYFRDDDGPAATAFIPSTFENCTLPGAASPSFCGQIPGQSNSLHYSNTAATQSELNQIYSAALIQNTGFNEKIGTQREVLNSDIVANWNINGYLRASSITAYHTNIDVAAIDGLQRPAGPGTYDPYYYTYNVARRDVSQELRLSSDPAQRFSWTVGGNFLRQDYGTSIGVDLVDPGVFSYLAGANNSPPLQIYSTTYAVFGGVYYKLTDKLSLSGEARYQSDKNSQFDGTDQLSVTTGSFTPRVALEYDIGGHRRIYTSYAEGTEPAAFNTQIAQVEKQFSGAQLAAIEQQVQAAFGSVSEAYKEERLKIGELGVKGDIFGSKGFFDLNGYYGQLSNQQISTSAVIPAYNGQSIAVTSNAGSSIIYGIEWQGSYNFTHDLSISTTYSWNHTDRNQFTYLPGTAEFGTTNLNGTSFAYVPQFQGSAVVAYTHEITEGWNGYGNVSATYRGKEFVDLDNAAYIPGRYQVDLRLGVQHGDYTVEVFCRNLLDDRNYTGGSVAPDYGSTTAPYAFFGAVAPPRQAGVRVLAKF